MKARRTEQAAAEFRKALAVRPRFPKAQYNLGLALASQAKWPQSAEALQASLESDPANANALWNLARVLERMGRTEEAVAKLRQCVRLEPSFADAWVVIGTALQRSGRAGEALRAYGEALKRDPVHKLAHTALLRALKEAGDVREWESEHQRYSRLTAPQVDGGSPAFGGGVAAMNSGKLDVAIALFELVLEREPLLFAAQRNLGICLFAAERYERAVGAFEQLLGLDHQDPETHLNLAMSLMKVSRLDEALVHVDEAIRLKPDYANAHYSRGVILNENSDREAAMNAFHRARRLDPQLRPPASVANP